MSHVAHEGRRALRIVRPNGVLHQPLPADPGQALSVIARFAPLVPDDAEWSTVEDRPLHPPAAPS